MILNLFLFQVITFNQMKIVEIETIPFCKYQSPLHTDDIKFVPNKIYWGYHQIATHFASPANSVENPTWERNTLPGRKGARKINNKQAPKHGRAGETPLSCNQSVDYITHKPNKKTVSKITTFRGWRFLREWSSSQNFPDARKILREKLFSRLNGMKKSGWFGFKNSKIGQWSCKLVIN